LPSPIRISSPARPRTLKGEMSAAVGANLFVCLCPTAKLHRDGTTNRPGTTRKVRKMNSFRPSLFFLFFSPLLHPARVLYLHLHLHPHSSSSLPSLPVFLPFSPRQSVVVPSLPPAFISLHFVSIATANPARVHSQTHFLFSLTSDTPFVQSGKHPSHGGRKDFFSRLESTFSCRSMSQCFIIRWFIISHVPSLTLFVILPVSSPF